MSGDAGANTQVSTSIDEQLADFGVAGVVVGQGVEDRRLAAYPVGVDISASVDVGAAIEEEAGGVQKAVFGGDVEKRRAT